MEPTSHKLPTPENASTLSMKEQIHQSHSKRRHIKQLGKSYIKLPKHLEPKKSKCDAFLTKFIKHFNLSNKLDLPSHKQSNPTSFIYDPSRQNSINVEYDLWTKHEQHITDGDSTANENNVGTSVELLELY